MTQERLGEFGLSTAGLVGMTSDGAATMLATGKIMGIVHQLCLGKLHNILNSLADPDPPGSEASYLLGYGSKLS